MKKHFAQPLLLAAILVVAFAAIAGSGRTTVHLPAPPTVGTVIDDFKLPDVDGAEHSLKALMGKKGAVLIFIATKCPVSKRLQ
jgi:cytochrome oxidase Cu insertion factor (SCO1/SenC/PrrC family)